MIRIKPLTIKLEWFKITNVSVTLNEGAIVSYAISDNASLSQIGQLVMDQSTYDNWGDDDSFVTSWALAELGLQVP